MSGFEFIGRVLEPPIGHGLVLEAGERVTNAITAACCGDYVYVVRSANRDLAAIENYLASCVRRRDWHGVSDAANDLRVLEAVEAARR